MTQEDDQMILDQNFLLPKWLNCKPQVVELAKAWEQVHALSVDWSKLTTLRLTLSCSAIINTSLSYSVMPKSSRTFVIVELQVVELGAEELVHKISFDGGHAPLTVHTACQHLSDDCHQ